MKDLIAKLEGLTGPDREVDAEISFYVEGTCFGVDFWKKYYGPDDPVDLATGRESLKTVSLRSFWRDDCDAPPAFTESLDAALGLVGDRSYCIWHDAKAGKYAAIVGELDLLKMEEAATAALALVKAALKAVAAEEG